MPRGRRDHGAVDGRAAARGRAARLSGRIRHPRRRRARPPMRRDLQRAARRRARSSARPCARWPSCAPSTARRAPSRSIWSISPPTRRWSSACPAPQRDEDLYRALALKIQAVLRATLSEARADLAPGSSLGRLVESGGGPPPEPPHERRSRPRPRRRVRRRLVPERRAAVRRARGPGVLAAAAAPRARAREPRRWGRTARRPAWSTRRRRSSRCARPPGSRSRSGGPKSCCGPCAEATYIRVAAVQRHHPGPLDAQPHDRPGRRGGGARSPSSDPPGCSRGPPRSACSTASATTSRDRRCSTRRAFNCRELWGRASDCRDFPANRTVGPVHYGGCADHDGPVASTRARGGGPRRPRPAARSRGVSGPVSGTRRRRASRRAPDGGRAPGRRGSGADGVRRGVPLAARLSRRRAVFDLAHAHRGPGDDALRPPAASARDAAGRRGRTRGRRRPAPNGWRRRARRWRWSRRCSPSCAPSAGPRSCCTCWKAIRWRRSPRSSARRRAR